MNAKSKTGKRFEARSFRTEYSNACVAILRRAAKFRDVKA
jgi:hypothetical protein